MKKKILNVTSIFLGINLFFIIFYLAFIPIALNPKNYNKYIDRDDFQIYYQMTSGVLDRSTTLDKKEIKRVLELTLDYMIKKADSIDTTVTFSNGVETNFYTTKELSHMKDCQVLFSKFRIFSLSILILTLLLIITIVFLRNEFSHKTIKYIIIGIGINILLILAIGIYGLIDFDNAFKIFHEILFSNDNWRFSYRSYMIQMLPADLAFEALAYHIIIVLLIYLAILISGLIVFYQYLKKRNYLEKSETKL